MTKGAARIEKTSMGPTIKRLQFEFEGVPEPLLQILLLNAAQELAEACVGTIDIDLMGHPDVREYEFSHCIPEGLEVVSIAQVIVCGQCLEPYDKCDPCPKGYQLRSPTCIDIQPCPPEKFTVCVVLRPTEACNSLPDCFARHRNYLYHAVAGMLSLQDGEEWASRTKARFHVRKAAGLRSSAAMRETRGHASAPASNEQGACLI